MFMSYMSSQTLREAGGSVVNGDDTRVYVVVPAYNEAENLAELVPEIWRFLREIDPRGSILIVDDGSTDETRDVAKALTASVPCVQLERLPRNLGKAAALRRGFTVAVDHGASVVVMMDADGQDDPSELSRLVEQVGTAADLVSGARTSRQDRFVKRSTSRLFNRVTRITSGIEATDFNSGFKAMSAPAASEVSSMLYGDLHRYISVIAYWLGYRVTEVPVNHRSRMHGTTKYGVSRFWRGLLDLLTVRFLMSYRYRPLHLFGGVGLVFLLVGGVVLLYLSILWLSGDSIGGRPLLLGGVLLVVVGFQLLLFGLLAEMIVYGQQQSRRD